MARIRTIKPEYKKKAIPCESRRQVALRYGCKQGYKIIAKCFYCGAEGHITWFPGREGKGWVHFQDLELDHVFAEWHGGEAIPDNLVLACQRCNRKKGTQRITE